jgi:hypothetical protein
MSMSREASQVVRPEKLDPRPDEGRETVTPDKAAVLARVVRASVQRLARGVLTVRVEGGGE